MRTSNYQTLINALASSPKTIRDLSQRTRLPRIIVANLVRKGIQEGRIQASNRYYSLVN